MENGSSWEKANIFSYLTAFCFWILHDARRKQSCSWDGDMKRQHTTTHKVNSSEEVKRMIMDRKVNEDSFQYPETSPVLSYKHKFHVKKLQPKWYFFSFTIHHHHLQSKICKDSSVQSLIEYLWKMVERNLIAN